MTTIFLQLIESDYDILVDGICFAINETNVMASKECHLDLKAKLTKESAELERILSELGNQAISQVT